MQSDSHNLVLALGVFDFFLCVPALVRMSSPLRSPLRANGNGSKESAPKRINLDELERHDAGSMLTSNLMLSASNPRASLSKGGGATVMQGGFKRTHAKHASVLHDSTSGTIGGQQTLLPSGMQKRAVVLFFTFFLLLAGIWSPIFFCTKMLTGMLAAKESG
jgi:hypothetical protein